MSSVPVDDIKTEEEVILENAEYAESAEELEEELQLQLEDSGGESYQIHYQTEHQVSNSRVRQLHQSSSNMNLSGGTPNKNLSNSTGSTSANKIILESEKRMRREIANSNERRRMQSINAGFQNLRSLLPRHEGEKLSKAAILQQTSQYICELENQKTQLLAQNSQLKRQLGQHESENGESNEKMKGGVAIKKRKLTDNVINIQTISDSSDEGLGSMSPEPMTLLNAAAAAAAGGAANTKNQIIIAHNTKELVEVRKQLDKERCLRTMLEEELQTIKRQLFSVATAATPQASSYIPREVIEHTDNLRDNLVEELPAGTVSYVEIDELTGQQQVVVCSSIEELDADVAGAAEMISEDNVHEEVILSSTSSTESEQEVNAIAKVYAEGHSPSAAVLQPILQAAIKATPKVEVERINETIMKVKTEKIEQPSGLTRSRQNLETIVEAIRHLEGDHLFADGGATDQHKLIQKAQEAPLALTTKQQQHQATRATLAELRPFLQIKGNKQVTIVGGGGNTVTLTHQQLAAATKVQQQQKESKSTVTPTAIFKVQTTSTAPLVSGNTSGTVTPTQQVTITTSALKQCRPGVIVAKQLS